VSTAEPGAAPWPTAAADLVALQHRLAAAEPPPWEFTPDAAIGGCFVCFSRGGEGPGATGDRGWAAAVTLRGYRLIDQAVFEGAAGGPYEPGLLALREGPLLEAAVRSLRSRPHVLLVNATGRDHPRRAGLALHLGAVLDVPTVGVTHRPLLASGDWPAPARGSTSPLSIDEEAVGFWVRTRQGVRPVAVHAAWRTDPRQASTVVLGAGRRARTPEPLRQARRLARRARSTSAG
jgi:deoxyribonuclease V